MAKKNGKLLALVALGAAAATYYYMKKKDSDIPVNMDDDDDLNSFNEDVDEESPKGKRSYVNLDFNAMEQKVSDAAVKVGEVANKAADSINSLLGQAEGKVEEFFDDRKTAVDIPIDGGEPSEDDYVDDDSENE